MKSQTTPSRNVSRIVFLDRASLPERIHIPPPKHPHKWVNYPTTLPENVIERCAEAVIVATNKVKISRATLLACPNLQHIAVTATGYNIIDIQACRDLGVSVSNTPNYAATTVAEHVLMCALSLTRELLSYRQNVIDGRWQKSKVFCVFDKPINNLRGKTLGILGFGEIGSATAHLAHAMGLNVIFNSRSTHDSDIAQAVSFEQLLSKSDLISVHCSLNKETHNIIGAKEIDQMKKHAILINTARGGVVNEADTVKAIENGWLGGIAFDVLTQEPPAADSPLLAIAARDNVIVTPHIGWASEQAMQDLANIVSQNIDAFLTGTPQNIVS